jgi:hypothetical protein
MGLIEQAIWDCSESIHRGDKCTECGAVWSNSIPGCLIHANTCIYLMCLDAITAKQED